MVSSRPVLASLVTLTRLMAAAAPMLATPPLLFFGDVAVPLAMTLESTSSEVLRVSKPLLVIEILSAGVASDFAVRMAIAAAAATVTFVPPPSPLFASGVLLAPESVPLGLSLLVVESEDVVLPRPRLASAFWFRSLLLLSFDAGEPSVSVWLFPVFSSAP